MNRDAWLVLGGMAAGAVGATLLMNNKEKLKPLAAGAVAKALRLKEKALDAAAKAKEHGEDIVAEARHLNEAAKAEA